VFALRLGSDIDGAVCLAAPLRLGYWSALAEGVRVEGSGCES
jgi:hypothetical protein